MLCGCASSAPRRARRRRVGRDGRGGPGRVARPHGQQILRLSNLAETSIKDDVVASRPSPFVLPEFDGFL